MNAGQVLYGPCPGCEAWQVQVDLYPVEPASAAVEEAIADHAAECPPLAEIIARIGHTP